MFKKILMIILFIPIVVFSQQGGNLWVNTLYEQNDAGEWVDAQKATIAGQSVNIREHLENMNMVNVIDFGAYNDSTNASITRAAIQAALDSAHSQGGYVYMPIGVYACDTSLNVVPGVPLVGQDKFKTVIKANHNYPGIRLSSTVTIEDSTLNNIHLANFTVQGSGGFTTFATDTAGTSSHGGITLAGGAAYGTTKLNNVIMENVVVKDFAKEAYYVWDARKWTATNCDAYNIKHEAFGAKDVETVIISGCEVDSVLYFYEGRVSNWPDATDNNQSTFIFTDNIGRNIRDTGLWSVNGENIIVTGNTMLGAGVLDTVSSERSGIYLRRVATVPSGDIENVTIANNNISGFKYFGIYLSTIGATNGVISGDINIHDNHIWDNGSSGLAILSDDSTEISGVINIYNNFIHDNLQDKVLDTREIYLSEINSPQLFGNKIQNVNKPNYVFFDGCYNPIFKNNDCRGGHATPYISMNDSTYRPVLYMNDGLRYYDALYNYGTAVGYYQNLMVNKDGVWKGGYPSEVGFRETIVDGGLVRIKYNETGTVVDTVTLGSQTARGIWYFTGKIDTIALTQNTWAWAVNSDSTLFQMLNKKNITNQGDSLLFTVAGIYEVHGNLRYRTTSSNTNRLHFILGTNGTGNSAGGWMETVDSTGYYRTAVFNRFYDISVNDYIKLWIKNYSSGDDVVLLECSIVFRKVE